MKVDALPGWDGLDEQRWNGLLDRSKLPSVFLTWQWQTQWAQAFAAERPLHLLSVTDDDGSLGGLLALHEEEPGRLRLLGGVDVSDYLDVIAAAGREEEVWHALLQHRAAQPVEWDLHAIRAASPTLTLVPALAAAYGLRVSTTLEERCPVLQLPESWDEYLARRKARFMDERMERFFRDATCALATAGWARLWFLECEGAPVASFLCLEYAGTVGLYNSGFDPAQARLAPGIVLLAHVIRDAIHRGIPTFDFLRGEEPYKQAFGPISEDLFNLRIRP